MRKMLVVIALAAVAAHAQDATLKVGDAAPPLQVAKWVKGEPVTLEPGKTYVVEFWATWCGPCVASMPHLSEMQERFKEKITFIGVTKEDQANTLEAVQKMVEAKGPGMGYTVAWDDAGKTYEAYMRAAGQNGIPCAFVIANGKVAHINHPAMLDPVVARVAAGTWDPEKSTAEIEQLYQRVGEIFQSLGLLAIGVPGTTAALALLNDAVKKGGAFASSRVGGLSGAFIPVSEDLNISEAVRNGHLCLEKLEAITSVCSVGLDMVAIPGDTSPETISAIIADEMAIGVINNKTTAARLIPVPGKAAGDHAYFGGLMGQSTILPVNNGRGDNPFIRRGGFIPAPIHSLKN